MWRNLLIFKTMYDEPGLIFKIVIKPTKQHKMFNKGDNYSLSAIFNREI